MNLPGKISEKVLYICDPCKRWEEGLDVTLYAPNDPEAIAKKQFGEKMVEEQEYHVIKRYYHTCKKCGKRMHKASPFKENHLPCPKCGTVNEALNFILWD